MWGRPWLKTVSNIYKAIRSHLQIHKIQEVIAQYVFVSTSFPGYSSYNFIFFTGQQTV